MQRLGIDDEVKLSKTYGEESVNETDDGERVTGTGADDAASENGDDGERVTGIGTDDTASKNGDDGERVTGTRCDAGY